MKYKLAVANTVTVPVFFKQMDGGKEKNFSFSLLMDRVTEEEWEASIRDDSGKISSLKIKEQMLNLTTGWEHQTFVLDESGAPAEFCQEALEVMFGVPGVLDVCLKSFIKESAAKGKN